MVRTEQVRLLYTLAPAGLLASLLVGIIVAFVLQEAAPAPLAHLWVTGLVVTALLRFFLIRQYHRMGAAGQSPAQWRRWYCGSCLLNGVIWGGGGLILASYGDLTQQVFLVLILGVVLGGTLSTMTAAPLSFIAFLIPALLPSLVWFLGRADHIYQAIGAATVLMAGLLVVTAWHLHRQLVRSLTLAFENYDLVHDLSAAKDQLEGANRELAAEIDERRRTGERLVERENHLRTIINSEPECVVLLARDGTVLDINPAGLAMLEASRAAEVIGRGFLDFLLPTYRPALRELLDLVFRGQPGKSQGLEMSGLLGRHRWLELHAAALRDARGHVASLLCVVHDITQRKRQAEEALFREKERVQVTLESIGDGVITTDVHGRIEYLNPSAERLTGWRNGEAHGKPLLEVLNLVDEATRTPVQDPVVRCLREAENVCLVAPALLLHRYEDREFAVKITAAPLRARERQVIGAVLVFHDVTELRTLARQMSYQASHDVLTQLINRREFETRLRQALVSARESSREHALCYLDLDQFKLVNDTCGHGAGDELLRQLAARLKADIRDRDTLARLGGDEFGVLFQDCPLGKARELAETLLRAIRDFRFSWRQQVFEVGASIGLVPVSAHSGDFAEIMSAADSACYMAKERGRNRLHVLQDDDADLVRRHREMQWAHQIQHALEDNRFQLYFQPIITLAPDCGSQIHHGELLLRMVGEDGGLIPPRVFLPAAERYNLMAEIDRWVLDAACAALRAGHPMLKDLETCNINLSGHSVGDGAFIERLKANLRGAQVAPQGLCFEISETAAIANLSSAMGFIRELRGLGCRFALDDFGSGLSSFAYLKTLPVDYLKIDGSFVKDMINDPVDHAMVDAINRIGHVMGVKTIAEFVEDGTTLERVRRVGIDYAQGFGVGAPCRLDS
ncbi:MAG: EAL domain-containing protein [Gammaproteobacteria bacterium]|nr:EAL domain-containing protein [Gammaproteobacteria bacterium]